MEELTICLRSLLELIKADPSEYNQTDRQDLLDNCEETCLAAEKLLNKLDK